MICLLCNSKYFQHMLYPTKFFTSRPQSFVSSTSSPSAAAANGGQLALGLLAGSSVVLALVRGLITGHWWFFAFVVWNLFLAVFPLGLMLTLRDLQRAGVVAPNRRGRVVTWLWLGMWLLFMPNAPYIITDLFHLRYTDADLIWYDTLMIFLCAVAGLLAGVYSTALAHRTLRRLTNVLVAWAVVLACQGLAGFGIYLGRYVRLNSWDLWSHPGWVAGSLVAAVHTPLAQKMALTYGFALTVIYVAFHIYSERKTLIV